MGLYEVSLSMSLLGFGMWAMLDNFHIKVCSSHILVNMKLLKLLNH